MKKFRKALLHGVLLASLAVLPVSAFGMEHGNGSGENGDKVMPPKTEEPKDKNALPHVEKTSVRFRAGVYYGRPYYYRPHYYYYPYRPYYYRYYYYPYRPYYRW